MAPTTQDAVEGVSGSRSRAERRLQRRPHEPAVTDNLPEDTQPEGGPSSQRGKRKAAVEPSEGEGRKKQSEGAGRKKQSEGEGRKKTSEGEGEGRKKKSEGEGEGRKKQSEGEGEGREKRRKKSRKDQPKKSATTASTDAAHASESEASEVSSPVRFPLRPNPDDYDGWFGRDYQAALDRYEGMLSKYHEKQKCQLDLVTLSIDMPRSSLVTSDLMSVRESATKTVLQVAKVVFSLSSYVDGKLMAKSSGFLIDWDKKSKTGTVLTSARIICSKYTPLCQWSGADEYSPNAKVVAHMLDEDDTPVVAKLLHYDKSINVALFTVGIESCPDIPTFSSDVKYGQETFVMGRDENMNLTVDHQRVEFKGPGRYERPHFMFTVGSIRESSIGGPVIDFDGQVLGMGNYPGAAFIPSSIILRCLDIWKKYQSIPRLHIGMKFSPIKFLDPVHVERIFRKCNVDSGLIVMEVSNGSIAEELGVRPGDIITSIYGECIATTVELENLNMRICEKHLDQGGTIGSSMDIPVDILHLRKGRKGPKRTLSLRLNVSDGIEVFRSLVPPFH